jgi:hypothetical protein
MLELDNFGKAIREYIRFKETYRTIPSSVLYGYSFSTVRELIVSKYCLFRTGCAECICPILIF